MPARAVVIGPRSVVSAVTKRSGPPPELDRILFSSSQRARLQGRLGRLWRLWRLVCFRQSSSAGIHPHGYVASRPGADHNHGARDTSALRTASGTCRKRATSGASIGPGSSIRPSPSLPTRALAPHTPNSLGPLHSRPGLYKTVRPAVRLCSPCPSCHPSRHISICSPSFKPIRPRPVTSTSGRTRRPGPRPHDTVIRGRGWRGPGWDCAAKLLLRGH